jgi:tripartite-type tricarboxylate transporter receptor subunit TctC
VLTGVTFSTIADESSPHKIEEFDWLVRTQFTPSMLFVPANSSYKSVEDLFADARKNPNKITVGTDGFGTPADLTLQFLAKKGIEMKNIPFDKPSERYLSPVAGHVDVLYEEPGDVRSFLDAGKIRPLILFAEDRLTEFPNVQTSYEMNLPVSFPNWRGVVSKKGVPKERLDILAQAFMKAMQTEKWKAFCKKKYSCEANPPTLLNFEKWVKAQKASR